MNVGEDRYKD